MPDRSDRRTDFRASTAALLMTLALALQACQLSDGPAPPATDGWYDIISQHPGPAVTDATMRRKLEASGHPWKVRDRATGLEMVLVMPGEFLMGSPESEAGRKWDEGPQHRVRMSRAYYLGATEVTQAQWLRLMGSFPMPRLLKGDSLPISPSWDDAQTFLSKANRGNPARSEPLRLPTEAEWEYACRAGTTGPYYFDGPIRQALVNFNDGVLNGSLVVDGKMEWRWSTPPSPECRMETAPAGSLPPNAWGLHEMLGSLWEWTDDSYASDSYAGRGQMTVDPFTRAKADEMRTLRGGSFTDRKRYCRAAARDAAARFALSARIGFRVARTL